MYFIKGADLTVAVVRISIAAVHLWKTDTLQLSDRSPFDFTQKTGMRELIAVQKMWGENEKKVFWRPAVL